MDFNHSIVRDKNPELREKRGGRRPPPSNIRELFQKKSDTSYLIHAYSMRISSKGYFTKGYTWHAAFSLGLCKRTDAIHRHSVTPLPVRCPNSTQDAGDALGIHLGLRVSVGGDDCPLLDGSHPRFLIWFEVAACLVTAVGALGAPTPARAVRLLNSGASAPG
ncbi:hypothetical protein EVAR_82123_1 [Eumeta japonica]|uniref:Uncharacterized protein n=1 Tax=Eumeta variegata TaxID=151549 RepID=A0A4C1U1W6_EUMVA|nr:hypothetical protein EVAR_82123_1 [Eumeta japonica]